MVRFLTAWIGDAAAAYTALISSAFSEKADCKRNRKYMEVDYAKSIFGCLKSSAHRDTQHFIDSSFGDGTTVGGAS